MTSQLDSTDPDLQDSACEVFLKGFYLRNYKTGQVIKTDLTRIHPDGIVYPTNTSIIGPQDVKLRVRHVVDGKLHDYEAVLGKDHEKDAFMSGKVTTSVGTITIATGWTVMVGQGPVGETGWATSTGHGTQMAVRIEYNNDPSLIKHFFYNLEPPGSTKTVVVVPEDNQVDPVTLSAAQYAFMPNSATISPATGFLATDYYVAYMCDRAIEAELKDFIWPWP